MPVSVDSNSSSNNANTTSSSILDRNAYDQLGESLTGITPDTALPVTSATPMIEIVAPATLAENYTFEAEVNGRSFTVMVPKGGVEEGQKFSVPLPGDSDAIIDDAMMSLPKSSIPVGEWKDGLCDWWKNGCCHIVCWNALFCTPIVTAQVMTRMKELTWLGRTGSVADAAGTFRIVYIIVTIYWIITTILYMITPDPYECSEVYNPDDPGYVVCTKVDDKTTFYWWLMVHVFYFAYTAYALRNTRKYVRSKYAIPEFKPCPTGCEDEIVSICCTCCAASQLARHTADYETYRGVCCSETGLPSHVPAIV